MDEGATRGEEGGKEGEAAPAALEGTESVGEGREKEDGADPASNASKPGETD